MSSSKRRKEKRSWKETRYHFILSFVILMTRVLLFTSSYDGIFVLWADAVTVKYIGIFSQRKFFFNYSLLGRCVFVGCRLVGSLFIVQRNALFPSALFIFSNKENYRNNYYRKFEIIVSMSRVCSVFGAVYEFYTFVKYENASFLRFLFLFFGSDIRRGIDFLKSFNARVANNIFLNNEKSDKECASPGSSWVLNLATIRNTI